MFLPVTAHRPAMPFTEERNQIPQAIGRIIVAAAVLIRIHLKEVLRPVRIVLQRRQCLHEPLASLVDALSRMFD